MTTIVSKPRTKENIVESDDSSGDDEDGPLYDEEDAQTDEMEVDRTKESSDEEEPDSASEEVKVTKLIQTAVEFLVSREKKELLDLLKDFRDEVGENWWRSLQ